MEFFDQFPTMEQQSLRDFKKGIDLAFRNFARTYGDAIESFFEPLLMFLVWLEKLLINSPWLIVILALALLAWVASRSILLVIGTIISFLIIGYFGMWKDTMATVANINGPFK